MRRATAVVLAVLAAGGAGLADQPTTAPAGGTVTVVSVTGLAQKCDTTRQPVQWETVAVGDVLGELTVIRTGLNSSVVLRMEDRMDVQVSAATKVGISELRTDGPKTTTRLGLKYGSVRAEVDSSRGPADFRVTTPTATLSVRGSIPVAAYMADLGSRGISYQGALLFFSALRQQGIQPGEAISESHALPVMKLLASFHPVMGDRFLSPPELLNQLHNRGGRGLLLGFVPTNSALQGPTPIVPLLLRLTPLGNQGPGNEQNPGWP